MFVSSYVNVPQILSSSWFSQVAQTTWQTSMLYSDIVPLIYVNETICVVICPSTRFKSIILWPWMNYPVPFWILRHSFLFINRLMSSDAYVRSFLYLFYTLIKLYYTKALSDPASSLAPDWYSSPPEAKNTGVLSFTNNLSSSFVILFSSCLQSFSASGSFPMSQLVGSAG